MIVVSEVRFRLHSHVVCCVVFPCHMIVKAVGNVVKLRLGQTTHETLVLHVCCD